MLNQLEQIIEPLLKWYRANARDLPWRHTADPYKIWVSEIMLQQTRVAAVLGYYHRFLNAFPTVWDLANASEEQLLKLWEGLGYYSRARNMQKAAKTIVNDLKGVFPTEYSDLLKLSGIGEYTAGAIASSAFGQRVAAVDGNVLRVVSRITENRDDINDPKTKKMYREILEQVLPNSQEDMRIFNQAMMELGATVCVPNGEPKCKFCPARFACQAAQNGTASELPVKSQKKSRRIENKTVFVLLLDDQVVLHKRGDNGLLAGLWEYPNVDEVLDEKQVYEYLADLGLKVTDWYKQLNAKHIFTHVEWHMTGYVIRVQGELSKDLVLANADSFEAFAIPSAFSKFTNEVRNILNGDLS